MITTALPIRTLSANVQYKAAATRKKFFSESSALTRRRLHSAKQELPEERRMVLRFAKTLQTFTAAQKKLVIHLRDVPDTVTPADFARIAGDLDQIVSLTSSILTDSYELPERMVRIWRPILETVADLNDHIESFAESFRIASDGTCTALLADIMHKVEVGETVSA